MRSLRIEGTSRAIDLELDDEVVRAHYFVHLADAFDGADRREDGFRCAGIRHYQYVCLDHRVDASCVLIIRMSPCWPSRAVRY